MRLRLVAVSLLCVAAGSAGAQASNSKTTQSGKSPELRIDYIEETLPNGLKVIYHVDRSTPVAAVDIWYNVGSKHELAGKTGFAHLFEHMMFNGSKNVGKRQHSALLQAAGARGGADVNGTTSWDRTNYFEQLPSNQLELALWLESDRMANLLPSVTAEALATEIEVVKNERRLRMDNQPYGSWVEKMGEAIFPAAHPYHHYIIGSMADLGAASVSDVHTFFKTYYAPNNAVLVIAGDIDVDNAKGLVRKYFAGITRGPAAPALKNVNVPALIGREQRQVISDPLAPAPAVYIGFRLPAAKDRRAAATTLLGTVLASGRAAPLYDALVRKQQVATTVGGGNFGLVDGADLLFFTAAGKPGSNPDSLERAVLAELSSAADRITQEGLDRARAAERFSFVDGLQTTGGFGGRADRLAEGWTYYRDANHVNKVLADYDRVTVADLKALARERLVPTNRVTLVYVPAPKPPAPQTSSTGTP